ncbi:MAG: DMT family transporter [Candidatus Heimdallarchaeota archaeon]
MKQNISLKRSYFFVVLAVIGWGLSTTFVELGLPYIQAQPFLTIRFIVATLIITPFIFATRKSKVIELFKSRWIYSIAIFETVGLITQYIAQKTVTAGLSALISMMFILILPYLSYIFLSEQFKINHGLSIVLGFIGVFLIVSEGDISNLGSGDSIGIFILLITAVAYAFYQLTTSKLTREVNPSVDVLSLFYVVMVLISVLSFSTAMIFEPSGFFDIKPDAWIWILLLAIFSTIIAFTSYFEASKGIQANTLSILLVSQALVPFFVDIFLLQRDYTYWVFFGGFIVIIAMIIVGMTPSRPVLMDPNRKKLSPNLTIDD